MTAELLPSALEKKLQGPLSISSFEIPRPTNRQQVAEQLSKMYAELEGHYGAQFMKSPLREIVQNAYTHSDATSPIEVDLYLASNDLAAYKCRDGGDYFADPQIKDIWEQRKDPPASKTRTHGHYLGHVAIYLFTQDLYVDTDQAAIFATQQPKEN